MTVHARAADKLPDSLTAALGWLAALAAVATLVLAPPSADAEDTREDVGAAPIVYGKATTRSQPVIRTEFPRFENSVSADVLPPLADQMREPAPRTRNNADAFANAGAIDLRPGAARIQPASFGPAPKASPVASAPRVADTIRSMMPATSPSAAFAEPVAGAPYQVEGRWFVPMHEPNYDEVGVASWYGPTFHGKAAANGEIFDEMAMTAAHPTLPLPSLVRVSNLENGKSIVVRLNDRGPFVDDRIIDLSKGAAAALDMQRKGTAKVRVQYVGRAPTEHNAAPAAAPVQVALRADDAAALQVRQTTPSVAPAERRLPVADPVDARHQRVRIEAGEGDFLLQAGSFADLGNAHKLRDSLASVGPVSVTAANVNGSEYYRVMVGPWPTRAAAVDAQTRVAQAGAKALIVTR